MSEASDTKVPAQLADVIAGVPKALIPASLKALDRLIGAAVDIPVAWLKQQKAKIDAQTEAYKVVEEAIAKTVATDAGEDKEIVQRAMSVLVRKEYRKQSNREAVAVAMIEDLRATNAQDPSNVVTPDHVETQQLDEDWLNVFERYAEDASTERMQKLWGRVLSGEVRKPGRYSLRTLRFLSEFSQRDAMAFASFADSAFSDFAPNKLVKPSHDDIGQLILLESSGLIQGASGLGLRKKLRFDSAGMAFIVEGNLAIIFKGAPNAEFTWDACVLTALGQELVSLIPGRDPKAVARKVTKAICTPAIELAQLCFVALDQRAYPLETLWDNPTAVQPPANSSE